MIQNSAQALEGARERGVDPQISVSSEKEGEENIWIRVRDNGPGIEPEDLDHVFDPFFTKRDVGEGMGLGLSICHRILESHEGRVEVESEPGKATVFSIRIPQPWQGGLESGGHSGNGQEPEDADVLAQEGPELEEAWKK